MTTTVNIEIQIDSANTKNGKIVASFRQQPPGDYVTPEGDLDFSDLEGPIDINFTVRDTTGHNIHFKKDQEDKTVENDAIWVYRGIRCPQDPDDVNTAQFVVTKNPGEEAKLTVHNFNKFNHSYVYRLNFIGRGAGERQRRYWLDPKIQNRGSSQSIPPSFSVSATVAVVAIAAVAIVGVVELHARKGGDGERPSE